MESSDAKSELENKLYHLEGDIWLVPCIANYNTNTFTPLFQPTSKEEASSASHRGWTELEDSTLLKLVQSRGLNSWGLIARELNSLLHGEKKAKIGRQCKERWNNYVDPSIVKGHWTLEEDIYLLEMQLKFGNKWSEVAKGLSGRNENSVKNRWNSMVKKAMRDCPQGTDPIDYLLEGKRKQAIEESSFGFSLASQPPLRMSPMTFPTCLLYTSDAADE